MCMNPIIKMVGFTVACEWEASFLMTRSDSRLRGLVASCQKTEEEICNKSTPLIRRTMLRWSVVKFELR